MIHDNDNRPQGLPGGHELHLPLHCYNLIFTFSKEESMVIVQIFEMDIFFFLTEVKKFFVFNSFLEFNTSKNEGKVLV